MTMYTLLFLCTGNYYRSRFAEILFNHCARDLGLPWHAESRGIAIEFGIRNVGPLSAHACQGLATRGVPLPKVVRFPRQLDESDLLGARHVVAVKEAEHRRLLRERFAGWEDRVEYWDIDDVDCAPPDTALALLEQEVGRLLSQARTTGDVFCLSARTPSQSTAD
jgi:protein-tyrosine phosphatase